MLEKLYMAEKELFMEIWIFKVILVRYPLEKRTVSVSETGGIYSRF